MNIAEQLSGVQDMAGKLAGMGAGFDESFEAGAQRAEWIERIYAAAEEPALWHSLMERVDARDEALRPHLERAVRLQRRLRALEAETLGLGAALDAAEQAVVSVNAKGKVTMMNSAARRMLEAADGLKLSPGGHLLCERADDTMALRKLVAEMLEGCKEGAVRAVAAMKIERRRGNVAALNVTALPLCGGLPGSGGRQAAMLLFLGDPDRAPRSRAEVMRSLYGLTPSEGRVCDGLLEGLETREVAARMRTTLETTRFHMKQILRKTGAGRQSELVRLMMALPTMR